MKKKILGGLIIVTILVIIPTIIFAYGGINTNITIGDSPAANSSVAMTNRIVGVLQVAGTIISVVALIIIGMRYMFSSIEEKAQMKGVLGYYIIGCVLVFATSNVLAIAYDLVTDLDHVYVDAGVIESATCVKQGKMKRICKDCGKEIIINTAIDSTKHSMGAWTVTKQESCTDNGTETRKCTNGCGKEETKTRAKKGHNYTNEIIKQATCTKEGYKGDKCKNCGHEKNTVMIAATGHNYKSTIIKQATCTAEGEKAQVCQNCNDKINEEKIAANGHSYKLTIIKEATCTVNGTKAQKCQICDTIKDGTTQAIVASGHSFGGWLVTSTATCTSAKVEKRTCSKCGDGETKTGTALGHNFGNWSETSAATCTSANVETRSCSRCPETQTQSTASAKGHNWKVSFSLGVVTWWKCTNCGAKSTEPFVIKP